MKKFRAAFAVLTIVLMTCAGVRAQKLAPKSAPLTTAPDLSKLNIEKILQQLQTPNVQASAQEASPLQVVADFLQLQPGQVSELDQLLQARQATLVPLLQTAQGLIQQLGNLLNSSGNPAQVGAVVIQIHAVQQQIAQHSRVFSATSWRSSTLSSCRDFKPCRLQLSCNRFCRHSNPSFSSDWEDAATGWTVGGGAAHRPGRESCESFELPITHGRHACYFLNGWPRRGVYT